MKPRNRRVPAAESLPAPDEVAGADGGAPDARSPRVAREGALVRAVRTVLGAALVLALSTTVAWAARRHIMTSPRFAVHEITVEGPHQRTAAAIEAEAGLTTGMNIFTLDLERARAKILNDPWIESATLTRQLPGKVAVHVTEREIGAIVALPEAYLAGRDGRIFKRLELGDPTDLPILTGITSEALGEDRAGVERIVQRALDLASDYEHSALGSRAPLQEIHVSNGGELALIVGKDGVSLALGLPPYRHKLEEASRIFVELDRRGAKAAIVMLDDEARPDRVVVRTR